MSGHTAVSLWKCEINKSDVCESETTAHSDDLNSNLEEEQEETDEENIEEHQLSGGCKFDGIWNSASIHDGTLTWNEGEDVPLSIISANIFQMHYVGKIYLAVLRDDGKLHWDDGDVWVRGKAKFDGSWGKAEICSGNLVWKEGEEVAIKPLSETSFE